MDTANFSPIDNGSRRSLAAIFTFKNFNKLLVLLMIALAVGYLATVNDLAIKGFALSDLKERRNRLAAENQKLELTAMNLSSYSAISEKVGQLKMVAVGDVSYLSAGVETMAKK